MRSIIAVSLLLALVATSYAAVGDMEMPCSELTSITPLWLNSSTQATKFVGNGFYAYSRMPNGEIYMTTYPGMIFMDAAELGLIPTNDGQRTKCAVHIDTVEEARQQGLLLRTLDFNSCQCKLTSGTRMLGDAVSEQFIELTITRPDWPLFSMVQTFALSNDTYEMPVAAQETTSNISFSYIYNPTFPKYSIEIAHWNWTVSTPTSGLRLFFNLHAFSDEDTLLHISTRDMPYYRFNYTTSKVSTIATFARAFNADGVDYVLSDKPDEDESFPIPSNTDLVLDTAVSVCWLYQPVPSRYINFTYDPSLQIIFIGDPNEVSPDATPAERQAAKKNRLHPAAYAVPIAVVVLCVIGFIGIMFMVPTFRAKLMPGSVRDKSLRATDFEQPQSTGRVATDTHAPGAAYEPKSPKSAKGTTSSAVASSSSEPAWRPATTEKAPKEAKESKESWRKSSRPADGSAL